MSLQLLLDHGEDRLSLVKGNQMLQKRSHALLFLVNEINCFTRS